MIRVTIAAILLISFGQAYSQKISITYYDSSWLLTTKKLAKFYRTGIIDTGKYFFYGEVKDYYLNAKLQMKGRYRANVKVDTFYFYYPTGQLMKKGLYVDNVRYGVWTNYYENGKVRDKVIFDNEFIAAIESYDKDGKPKLVNGTGDWETEYYDDLLKKIVTVKGEYKDTLRHGTWNYYEKPLTKGGKNDNRLECTEVYKEGKFVKGKYFAGGGIREITSPDYTILPEVSKFERTETWQRTHTLSIESYPYLKFLPRQDSVERFMPVDKMPEFPGGMTKFYSYIQREFKCSTKNRGTDKKIFVEFVVDSTGYVRKGAVKFLHGEMGQICKDKITSVLENSPKWTPGHVTEMKKDVPVRMVLPMNLK